jgi:glucose-1-phosphate cytidylyltransferase
MKTVILCGGRGTRLKEHTDVIPKPLVEVGSEPILWHIMNLYAHYGMNEFVLALGYKGEKIKEFFLNYYNYQSDLTISLKTGEVTAEKRCFRDWLVSMSDTGNDTMTGGRLLRLKDKLSDGTFLCTYGDGVGNIDIAELVAFHKAHGKIATVTSVRPIARFGGMEIKSGVVNSFQEKPQTGEGWINGGFFVFEPQIFDYLSDDACILEREPMERLVADNQLMAYEHKGFWQCMDTVRDRDVLEELWVKNEALWKVWRD